MTAEIDNEESRKARARIAQFHLLLDRRNHFELLGVDRMATEQAIRDAFKDLAKRWHADAYADLDIADERRKLDEIFQRLNEAYETLTDPDRRAEYLVFLERSAKGLATDVHGILRAEAMVDEALLDMRRKQWTKAIEKLAEAKKLNPDDPLYDVHLAWARYHLKAKSEDSTAVAIRMLKDATKKQQNLALAYQYLGQIQFNSNDYAEAKRWWKLCLQYDPRNVDVQRGLRLINSRAQKQQTGLTGFLNKLRGKK